MIITIIQLRKTMSNIKKAVLVLLVAVALLIITMPVQATGNAKFGLTQINSDSTTLKLSVDHEWDNPLIDFVVETDYVYKEQSDVVKMDKFSIIGKANKDITPKYYAFSVTSYDTDKLRASGDRVVAGAGVGYTGIRVRGSDATRVNVTINGIPFNDAEGQGVYWVNMPCLLYTSPSPRD